MKYLTLVLVPGLLYGCAQLQPQDKLQPDIESSTASASPVVSVSQVCPGSTELPAAVAAQFEPADDPVLLQNALGQPNAGKLCQGRVYRTRPDSRIIIYRAWNSTNPNSEKGNWWAWQRPAGQVAQYRMDYEICYQWSPLDKLDRCTLNAGVTLVVGTGQSATCSQYLSYPASPVQQIYIENAAAAVAHCTTVDDEFSWTHEGGD